MPPIPNRRATPLNSRLEFYLAGNVKSSARIRSKIASSNRRIHQIMLQTAVEYSDGSLFVMADKNYRCTINFRSLTRHVRDTYEVPIQINCSKIEIDYFINIQVYTSRVSRFT